MHRILLIISLMSLGYYRGLREAYVGELLSSFLPYLILVRLVLFLLSLVMLVVSRKRTSSFVSGVSMIVFCYLSIWGGDLVRDFYDTEEIVVSDETRIAPLHILYGNIYIYNDRYESLQQMIEFIDPDILVLVEFARHHWSAIEDFLHQEGLVYTNRINRDALYDSNLFASHEPIDQVISYTGLDDYINIESQQMSVAGMDIMFHVVHTISPVSPDHFKARNRQLESLATLMKQATSDYPTHTHILLGDFNTSPWSVYYQTFVEDLGPGWDNKTRQTPLLMTRRLSGMPWIRSHIDHIFVRGDTEVIIEPYRLDGSDHRMLDISIY